MEYFIYKNLDSRNIKGLVVREIPPITKPRMRVRVDTIDGKDGNQITELGYEAYEKEVKIGLTRDYTIDNIIDWLNGEGQIIFSNEPDKYYRVKVIEQVDYEKLLRFKTATIKFNTQPFKYSATERLRTFNTSGIYELEIRNAGNYFAKPIITIYGKGTINLSVNGLQVCVLNLDPATEEAITLDTDKQEAYSGNALKNRQMDGQFPKLAVGKNVITWTGEVSKIEILNYSRWL